MGPVVAPVGKDRRSDHRAAPRRRYRRRGGQLVEDSTFDGLGRRNIARAVHYDQARSDNRTNDGDDLRTGDNHCAHVRADTSAGHEAASDRASGHITGRPTGRIPRPLLYAARRFRPDR